jgi:hypothetical protein
MVRWLRPWHTSLVERGSVVTGKQPASGSSGDHAFVRNVVDYAVSAALGLEGMGEPEIRSRAGLPH